MSRLLRALTACQWRCVLCGATDHGPTETLAARAYTHRCPTRPA